MSISFREGATLDDIDYLSVRLREADKREIQAGSGLPPYDSLLMGVRVSSVSAVALDEENHPFAIWGIRNSSDPSVGIAWMMATDGLIRHRRELVKLAPQLIRHYRYRWPVLSATVDARNKTHIRWLERLGFRKECSFLKVGRERHRFHVYLLES